MLIVLGLRQMWLGRAVPSEHGGTELDVSRLGHEGWDCTGSFRGP